MGCKTLQGKYAERLEKENKQLKSKLYKVSKYVDNKNNWFTIIKPSLTSDDIYIKRNGLIKILKRSDKNE